MFSKLRVTMFCKDRSSERLIGTFTGRDGYEDKVRGTWIVSKNGDQFLMFEDGYEEETASDITRWIHDQSDEFLNFCRVEMPWTRMYVDIEANVRVEHINVSAEFNLTTLPDTCEQVEIFARFKKYADIAAEVDNIKQVCQHIANVWNKFVSPQEVGFMADPRADYEEYLALHGSEPQSDEPLYSMDVNLAKIGRRMMDDLLEKTSDLRYAYKDYMDERVRVSTLAQTVHDLRIKGFIGNEEEMDMENILAVDPSIKYRLSDESKGGC